MSWNFQIDVAIKPRENGYNPFANELESAVAAEKKRLVNGFPTAYQVERSAKQMDAAAITALELFRRTKTEYPTGCSVKLSCDGYAGADELNFEPHHVCVRLQVIPVPFHR